MCHGHFTEMHAFKHHQSIVEECHAAPRVPALGAAGLRRPGSRDSFDKNMTVYEEYLELLHAAYPGRAIGEVSRPPCCLNPSEAVALAA